MTAARFWDLDEPDRDGLRYYQREAELAIDEGFARVRALLLVMATGLGKTQVAGATAKRWLAAGKRVLMLANRDELVDQARERLEEMTGEVVEIEQGPLKCSRGARCVVGSVQTFHKKRLATFERDRFDLIIFDEADLSLAPSYKRVLDYFTGKLLGLTATPDRGDGRALGILYDEVAYQMDILKGLEAGYLAPIRGQHIDVLDVSLIKKTRGDLSDGEVDEAVAKLVKPIVAGVLEYARDRQTIVFFAGKRSAELAAIEFNEVEPGSAAFICDSTPRIERKTIVRDYRNGVIKRLCNVDIATRGFDAPTTSCIADASPSCSRNRVTQRIGRGARVLPGIVDPYDGAHLATLRQQAIAKSKKPDCLWLDFVSNSGRHSLVGPEDILGGEFNEETRAVAKKKRQGGDSRNTLTVLREARAELERIAKTKAQVKLTTRPFNPFTLMSIAAPKTKDGFRSKPISPKQRMALEHLGVPESETAVLTWFEASKILDEMNDRRRKGYCTFKQLKTLRKQGIHETKDRRITFERANEAITYLVECHWRPDASRLNQIVFRAREAGDD